MIKEKDSGLNFEITTPAKVKDPPTNSYVVEISTLRSKEFEVNMFEVGPFKKNSEEASLVCLLETLKRVEERTHTVDTFHNYNGAWGFMQWFSKKLTIEAIHETEPLAMTFFGQKEHQDIIDLVGGKHHLWPLDGSKPSHTYTSYASHEEKRLSHERLSSYKVFYYDANSVKFNVKVTK